MDKQIYSEYGIELRADVLAALGAISVAWGQINSVFEMLIWIMAHLNKGMSVYAEAQMLTAQLNFHSRTRILTSLAKLPAFKGTEFSSELQKVINNANTLRGERNDYIHAVEWYTDNSQSPMTTYAMRSKLGGKNGLLSDQIKFDKPRYENLIKRMASCRDNGWKLIAQAEAIVRAERESDSS